jgi:hypothetical protein
MEVFVMKPLLLCIAVPMMLLGAGILIAGIGATALWIAVIAVGIAMVAVGRAKPRGGTEVTDAPSGRRLFTIRRPGGRNLPSRWQRRTRRRVGCESLLRSAERPRRVVARPFLSNPRHWRESGTTVAERKA